LNITFSTVLSCLNNDGPYLAGAFEGYGGFTPLSKIVFMLLMLIGRLEIFPLLLLFIPKTWNKNY
jgi:trk system potassium uptake protein TrkH